VVRKTLLTKLLVEARASRPCKNKNNDHFFT
jgi:hypothetical protein